MSLARIPLAAAAVGLAVALTATLSLHRSATGALDRVLAERLRGAGTAAAELLADVPPTPERLRAIMDANALEGAYVLSPDLVVLADATGPAGDRADLLRVDAGRVARALHGEATIAFGYAVGDLPVATGYFPIRGPGAPRAVLALEAGESFAQARAGVRRALIVAMVVSALGALSLAALGVHWARGEAQRRTGAERAARGDALARMGAMVAHEIRNPLGVIRGAVELVRERTGDGLAARDREALEDVLGEVERLRRLTDDFLDLAREPSIAPAEVDAAAVAEEAARGLARSHPRVDVRVAVPALPVRADPARLRQVLSNLLQNAAEAGAARIEIRGSAVDGAVVLEVRDDGRGVDPALRGRLFEPFATGRKDGAGLGLAIARRIVERHGGELRLVAEPGPGAAFEVRLPRSAG
ncbi:sensor histidine kinase [Anaeromyxobacter terrae]|uniref:sensor histidine kinase n=1 Tax=Anaeromyxobacter terrae TaxID=2925406 RepID=UPI001F56575F|nr:HAMP domain-containing sensor histidine kinase [Anaeromyxobacter sp. SG22]